jgi:hypothetical protein
MIKSFVNTNHKCTICKCIFTEDEGGTLGDLGMLPVSFCPSCFSGLCEMVDQGNDNEWVGLTADDMEGLYQLATYMDETDYIHMLMMAEAKLKEKNT